VNSIEKTKYISYSQQTYAKINNCKIYSYTLNGTTPSAGKFLPKTKGFFPHDFTLIAAVVRESVIGHGIGGKVIPAKMVQLAKSQLLE
jgi:hypothetical protein